MHDPSIVLVKTFISNQVRVTCIGQMSPEHPPDAIDTLGDIATFSTD